MSEIETQSKIDAELDAQYEYIKECTALNTKILNLERHIEEQKGIVIQRDRKINELKELILEVKANNKTLEDCFNVVIDKLVDKL